MTDRLVAIAFNTMSTRNAGFATVDFNAFTGATINIHSFMMFIGSGPGSTAGGIRTTTLFVIFAGVGSAVTGRKEVDAFKRKIPDEAVREAYILTTVAFMLTMFGAVAVQAMEIGNISQTY
jgi:trk system potassium uptake protein TrkH